MIDADGVHRVSVDEHLGLSTEVLSGLGAPERAAREQAGMLLEGDLRGHASHGIRRLPVLAGRIGNGVLDPAAEPELRWTTDSVLTVDGGPRARPPHAPPPLPAPVAL
ncbi:Ldh family oxidoreductase, partial [Pseudonocardia sp. NPDC049154]|uniref:Ldh family oxidoreductase n=1 Tax=Pseudonocardia sp. NPDC049154 TaxID=3155501 RepID=UPI003410C241